jgi:hypothetical protein
MPQRRQLELSDEDFWALQELADLGGRSWKEQAEYLLREAIRAARAGLERLEGTADSQSIAAA